MSNLKNQPQASAIDRIARWYGRAKAVERVAKVYAKSADTPLMREDFKSLRKRAKRTSDALWRLGIVNDHLAREVLGHVLLPMDELKDELDYLEGRLGNLLDCLVKYPIYKQKIVQAVDLVAGPVVIGYDDVCAHCGDDIGTSGDTSFYRESTGLWYCCICAWNTDVVPEGETDEYRRQQYDEMKK